MSNSKNPTETTLVKEPYKKTSFDDIQLQDFIKCCDPKTGYLHFMDNFFYIQHPTRGSMPYHPWDFQKRLIETYHNYRYSIALMPRQSGKCFGINTIVKLKNTSTNIIEEITIGEFYDRFSKVPDMSGRNEGASFASFSQTQDDSDTLQKLISWIADTQQKFTSIKFSQYVRGKKSWIPTWWETLSIFKKIYTWQHFRNYKTKSRKQQKEKWFSCNTIGILDKKDKWRCREGTEITHRTTKNVLSRKMHRKIWRRWIKGLEFTAAKMDEKFQKTKFFCDLSKIIQSNNGDLSFRPCLLCYDAAEGYGRVCKQRISADIKFWENYSSRLYRFIKKENNRVRWNILARTNQGEYKERTGTRTGYISQWISNTTSKRGGLYEKPKYLGREMRELSDRVERKFIESYSVHNYEIMTDTGWEKISNLHVTIPYDVYKLETESGMTLECADTHILFDENMEQVFVNELNQNSRIQTDSGVDKIKYVVKTKKQENMFDITVDSKNHRFYTNGILSHNTTSAAGYLLWYAMFNPDSTILIAAHKYTGAQEIMQRIRYAYENCPDHIKAGVTTYNKGSLDFENGSRIVSATTTENTGRGMSISLLYLDEFAFVRPSIAQEFWTSITPTLATGGKAIITSTPNSDEDQFALIWKGANKCEDEFGNTTDVGVNGFKAFRAYYWEQPGRDEKWASEMKAQLGEDRFRREIGTEFIIADETLINPNTLFELQGIEPTLRMGQVRWFKKPEKGNIYVVGLDPSLGTGSDPAAIEIFEANTTTQVGEWKHNKTSIPNQIKLLTEINKYIVECTEEPDNLYYSIENNSIGEAALVSLHEFGESNISGIFLSEYGKKRKGFNTTHKVKLTSCSKLKSLLESKKMKIYSKALVSELKTFVALGGSYRAKVGDTDDLIMASLLVIRMIQQLSDFHVDLEAQIKDHDEVVEPFPFFAIIS